MCDARRGRNCRILPRPLRPILTVLAFRGLRLAGRLQTILGGLGLGAGPPRSGRPRDPRRVRFGDPDGTRALNYAPRAAVCYARFMGTIRSGRPHNFCPCSCADEYTLDISLRLPAPAGRLARLLARVAAAAGGGPSRQETRRRRSLVSPRHACMATRRPGNPSAHARRAMFRPAAGAGPRVQQAKDTEASPVKARSRTQAGTRTHPRRICWLN